MDLKSAIGVVLYGPIIKIVGLAYDNEQVLSLHEGRWLSGRFDRNIRIDRNSHFHSTAAGGLHAHVYGRRDRDRALVAVKFDGAKSHGLGDRLHADDADALRQQGFNIPRSNIVEYVVLEPEETNLLLEQFGLSSSQ